MDYPHDVGSTSVSTAAVNSSPQSRTRLVVAAQALDIQHLQDVIRTKDRELSENSRQNQEALEGEVEKNRILTAKNARLESQVQLLAMKLHELEEQKEQQLGAEVSNMMTMAQSGKERDTLIGQLREELKTLRSQNNALNQEREVILEKLVLERKKVAALENRTQSNLLGSTPGKQTAKSLIHRSCQTSDMTLSESLLDDASVVPIETLKRHIELEQQELQYHQEYAARHAANTNELHARMQERLQYEVSRLNQEQEKYQSLLQSYVKPTLPTTNMSKSMSPAPSHSIVLPNQIAQTATSGGAPDTSLGNLSFQQAPNTSPGPGSLVQETKARVPFFQQQEKEMQAIRERLLELQEAHNSGHPAHDREMLNRFGPANGNDHESASQGASFSGVSSVRQKPSSSASGASSVLQRMLSKATQ